MDGPSLSLFHVCLFWNGQKGMDRRGGEEMRNADLEVSFDGAAITEA